MTRVLAAVGFGVAVAAAITVAAAVATGVGLLVGRYVMVPFHDPQHMAHWPAITGLAALTLTVLMALTHHHRENR